MIIQQVKNKTGSIRYFICTPATKSIMKHTVIKSTDVPRSFCATITPKNTTNIKNRGVEMDPNSSKCLLFFDKKEAKKMTIEIFANSDG